VVTYRQTDTHRDRQTNAGKTYSLAFAGITNRKSYVAHQVAPIPMNLVTMRVIHSFIHILHKHP